MTSPRTHARRRDETARIHRHLAGAERLARHAAPTVSGAAALVRSLLLDELARYRNAGVFPANTERTERSPTFVDRAGNPCAVAHLMAATGRADVVARIADTQNLATIAELAADPALRDWLAAVGLTEAEAARIQPTYETKAAECICGGSGLPVASAGVRAVLEVQITAGPGDRPRPATIVAIYGAAPEITIGEQVLVLPGNFGENGGPRALVDVGPAAIVAYAPSDVGDAAAPSTFEAIVLAPQGLPEACFSFQYRTVPGDTALAANARLAGDQCEAYLGAVDPAWTTPTKSGGVGSPGEDTGASPDAGTSDAGGDAGPVGSASIATPPPSTDEGCNVTAADPSVAALLAIVGVLVARRRPR